MTPEELAAAKEALAELKDLRASALTSANIKGEARTYDLNAAAAEIRRLESEIAQAEGATAKPRSRILRTRTAW